LGHIYSGKLIYKIQGGQKMTGTKNYLQSLMVTKPLQEPIFLRAIHALNLPPGSRGLDVGCGIGLHPTDKKSPNTNERVFIIKKYMK
jgi:hypothetical protein